MTHLCASKLGHAIGSDNGLSSVRQQAIIGHNAGSLSVAPLETNFNKILINQSGTITKNRL